MHPFKKIIAVLLVLALLAPAVLQVRATEDSHPDATVLQLNPYSIHGFAGEKYEIAVSPRFSEELREPISWTVSNPSVASVSDLGVVTLLSPGSTTVTASTPKGAYGHCVVKVLDTPELTCGVEVMAEVDEHPRQFTFTPEKDGWYSIFTTGCPNKDYYAMLCDSNRQVIGEAWENELTGHFEMNCQLTAGEEYLLKVRCKLPDGGGQYRLQVLPMGTAQGMTLSSETLNVRIHDHTVLYAFFQPVASLPEDVTWTSSDSSVARIRDPYPRSCQVYFDSLGTATITATTESGLSATCQVTVEQYPTLTCGEPVTVDPQLGHSMHCFIPEEDGWYGFYTTGTGSDPVGILRNSNFSELDREDDGAEGDNFMVVRELTAGEPAYIETYCWGFADEIPFQLHVDKAVPATSIKLSCESATCRANSTGDKMVAKFYPMPAIPEKVTWTSSDLSVVEFNRANYLWSHNPGTATVTATTASGLTSTCQVTVEPLPVLPLGEEVPVVYDGETLRYTFTPETSGYYCFSSTDAPRGMGLEGSIIGPKWTLTQNWGSPDFCCRWNMSAGVTYELTAKPFDSSEKPISFNLRIMPMVPAEDLVLDRTYLTGYMGEMTPLVEALEPFNALEENITWTCSDEYVALCLRGMVHFRYPGTCVVTATSESGLVATCTVVVRSVPDLSCGDTLALQKKEGLAKFRFTPEADGEYCLETLGLTRSSGRITEANGDYLLEQEEGVGELSLTYSLKANNIYYLVCDPLEAAGDSYQLSLTRVSGQTVQGSVSSAGDAPVTLELLKEGKVVDTLTTVDGRYRFENVTPGSYILRIRVPNHVTRDYAITTGTEPVTLAAEASLLGDVNGDGRVNIGDAARIYSHVKQTSQLTDDYRQACANVNGGSLNIGDVASLYSHIQGTKKLY